MEISFKYELSRSRNMLNSFSMAERTVINSDFGAKLT